MGVCCAKGATSIFCMACALMVGALMQGSIGLLRTIQRLDGANGVKMSAVFFFKPRKRSFINPNWRLMTQNGCFTLARTLVFFRFSAVSSSASASLPLSSARRLPGRRAMCQVTLTTTEVTDRKAALQAKGRCKAGLG